jgi:outer membrane lipoprotein SlyB
LDVKGILEGQQRMKIKNLLEGLNAQQRSVPQLPAQARARHISVLGAKTDPKHPFAGYMVGADESTEPGRKRLGPDENDPYEQGWRTGHRRGQDDTACPYRPGTPEHAQWMDGYEEAQAQPNHYDEGVAEEQLDEKCWDGYEKKGMKTMFGKRVPNCVKNEGEERNELDTPAVQAALAKMAERHKGEKWSKEQLAALGKRIAARGQNKKDVEETNFAQAGEVLGGVVGGIGGMALTKGKKSGYVAGTAAGSAAGNAAGRWIDKKLEPKIGKDEVGATKAVSRYQKSAVSEDVTKEDIITKLKARLGDYLSDIGKEIKKDPDLVDKLAAKAPGDQMGPPVKTVTTDDGHQIQIHGNEDDGFRISIKNKQSASKFKNLDEAVMACEMYCAQRRKQAESADYIDEAGKDACYHKVKSRYKIWPSAYASGALVRCRKVGADNWGNKSKK